VREGGESYVYNMDKTKRPDSKTDPAAYECWLDGIAPLQEGAELRGVHVDTLKRLSAKGKIKLHRRGERLLGIRRRDALMIPQRE
jgi:hypothetical protein